MPPRKFGVPLRTPETSRLFIGVRTFAYDCRIQKTDVSEGRSTADKFRQSMRRPYINPAIVQRHIATGL